MPSHQLISRDVLNDALDNAGLERTAMRESYSGRNMYGDTCIGLTVAYPSEVLRFAAHLGAADADLADDLMDATRSDSMGKDMIYYWPGWTITDAPHDQRKTIPHAIISAAIQAAHLPDRMMPIRYTGEAMTPVPDGFGLVTDVLGDMARFWVSLAKIDPDQAMTLAADTHQDVYTAYSPYGMIYHFPGWDLTY